MIVSLNVQGWPCLVVGGGRVALRKAETLVADGAVVTLLAPEILPHDFSCREIRRAYVVGDCASGAGYRLVYACTDSADVNAAVAREARERGALCNIADAPAESDFANVATVRRGEIEIGISTGGHSAALARHLKERVEEVIGPEYAELAELLGARRAAFTATGTPDSRAAVWRTIIESEVLKHLRAGNRSAAGSLIDDMMKG